MKREKREKGEKKVIEVRSGVVIFIGDERNICFWSIHREKMEHVISRDIFWVDALFLMSKNVFVAVRDDEKLKNKIQIVGCICGTFQVKKRKEMCWK